MADTSTTESTCTRLRSNARVLQQASVNHASAGRGAEAVVTQWGSDISLAECVLIERTSAQAVSDRALLRAVDGLIQRIDTDPEQAPTGADLLTRARRSLRNAADPGIQRELGHVWTSLDHLASLAAPQHADLEAAASGRLGGMSPAAFVAARRTQAREAMAAAQNHRIANRSAEGIQSAYESDLAALEAALVESAVAVGDPLLMSVTIRWELASQAIREIPGLPDSVVGAAQRIRSAVADALGPADGVRVLGSLLPLS